MPQSIRSNLLRKACAHCSTDQVSWPSKEVTCFENLHITDIIALNLSFNRESVNTESKNSIKKGLEGEFIC